ncbi:MAG: response regulator transcription factor [Planctomycetes bacterium]|nr:response regulator transcription factor [Planctomycetota bacterium]
MNVLVVDDDEAYRELLLMALDEAGMQAVGAADAPIAMREIEDRPRGFFDVLLLDVQMPGALGFDLLEDLRDVGNETPAIFLTGVSGVPEKVRGLRLGADDYLVKPVEIDELLARLEAVAARHLHPRPLVWGEIELDVARRRALRGGVEVELSPREFDLLLVLVRARGEIVPRSELLHEVWNMDFDPGTNLLDVHIGRLRKKVDRLGRPLIHNERGQGYRVVAL